MIPGPDMIVACPRCGTLAKVFSLISGNTFHGEYWTDGKAFYPMLPSPPAITRCKGCDNYYWLSGEQPIGFLEWCPDGLPDDGPKEPSFRFVRNDERPLPDNATLQEDWFSVGRVTELNEEQFLQAAGLAEEPEAELYLRTHAWWASNDPFRECGEEAFPAISARSEAARDNLQLLLGMLPEDDVQGIVVKAEAARELEDFDLASKYLMQATAANGLILHMENPGDMSPAEFRELAPTLAAAAGEDFIDSLPRRRAAEERVWNSFSIRRVRSLVDARDPLVRKIDVPDPAEIERLVEVEMGS